MDDFELVAWQKAVWKTFPATFTALLNGGDVKLPRSWPGRGRFFSACPWNKGPGTGQRARQSCKRTTPSFSQDTLFVSRLSKPRTPTYSRWVYGAGHYYELSKKGQRESTCVYMCARERVLYLSRVDPTAWTKSISNFRVFFPTA